MPICIYHWANQHKVNVLHTFTIGMLDMMTVLVLLAVVPLDITCSARATTACVNGGKYAILHTSY